MHIDLNVVKGGMHKSLLHHPNTTEQQQMLLTPKISIGFRYHLMGYW